MLYYFKDEQGVLRVVMADFDVNDQAGMRRVIRDEMGITPQGAILGLAVDNPPLAEEPAAA